MQTYAQIKRKEATARPGSWTAYLATLPPAERRRVRSLLTGGTRSARVAGQLAAARADLSLVRRALHDALALLTLLEDALPAPPAGTPLPNRAAGSSEVSPDATE